MINADGPLPHTFRMIPTISVHDLGTTQHIANSAHDKLGSYQTRHIANSAHNQVGPYKLGPKTVALMSDNKSQAS